MASSLGRWRAIARRVGPGVGAYLLGYLLTYGWLGNRFEPIASTVWVTRLAAQGELRGLLATFVEPFGGVSATTWSGWLFYNAHFVPLSVTIEGRGVRGSVPNVLFAGDPQHLAVSFLVPPVLLVVAGAISASLQARPAYGGLLPQGATAGMPVVAGYLPLAVIGAVVFTIGEPMRYRSLSPSLLWSVLVMGIAYPLGFGGLGGWLVTTLRPSAGEDTAGDPTRPFR